ncbi:class E sortase [Actinotalea sp. Marseille-Q4924]|uniref:class E sortase n=1 Tax=Actinotalea sp. Marseille-Q4924 TaxID=2866571 RepID=UPI001CE43901|nr:class E sortase [Actinotalea sp. Marseille-Q4924]
MTTAARSPGAADLPTLTSRRALRRAAARRCRAHGARVVGVVGELLITLGALLALFVVWQLFWTDVVAERAQDQVVQELGWARTADDAPGGGGQEPAPAVPAAPAPEEAPAETPERRDAAPVLAEQPHATTFATLAVPRWGPDYVQPISEGVTRRDVLDVLGIGHYPGTAMPGEVGNFAVAAHRVTYGKPFNRVAELQVGDPLVVQTQDAWYVYRVSSTQIVLPQEVDVIAPVPDQPDAEPTQAMITLTTCHPMFSARERFIVHGELDYWMPTDAGTPVELTGEGS